MNYKTICNLAMSRESGYVFILFDTIVLHMLFNVDAGYLFCSPVSLLLYDFSLISMQ
jgi:hypothetical protein